VGEVTTIGQSLKGNRAGRVGRGCECIGQHRWIQPQWEGERNPKDCKNILKQSGCLALFIAVRQCSPTVPCAIASQPEGPRFASSRRNLRDGIVDARQPCREVQRAADSDSKLAWLAIAKGRSHVQKIEAGPGPAGHEKVRPRVRPTVGREVKVNDWSLPSGMRSAPLLGKWFHGMGTAC